MFFKHDNSVEKQLSKSIKRCKYLFLVHPNLLNDAPKKDMLDPNKFRNKFFIDAFFMGHPAVR